MSQSERSSRAEATVIPAVTLAAAHPSKESNTTVFKTEQKTSTIDSSLQTQKHERSSTRRVLMKIGNGLGTVHKAIDHDAHDDLSDIDELSLDDYYDSDDSSLINSDNTSSDDFDDLREGDEVINEEQDHRQQSESKIPSNGSQPTSTQPTSPDSLGPSKGQDPSAARQRFVPEKASPQTTAARSIASTSKSQAPKPDALIAKKDVRSSTTTSDCVSGGTEDSTKAPSLPATDKPAAKPTAKKDPFGPTDTAPYGYKLVKVRKPDGTITKVKRPLTKEEAEKVQSTISAQTAAGPSTDNTPAMQPSKQPTAARPRCAGATEPPTTPVAKTESLPSNRGTSQSSLDAKSKCGITVTEKEISQDRDIEIGGQNPYEPSSTTRRTAKIIQILSWSVMVFFPLLYIGLAIWTAFSDGKRVPQNGTTWLERDPLSQSIKVATSLWPIVFAAVLAQTLKAYAAYKVERGIPLMTLEQLISSNSVGGAVKQPFMLRTFNLTTLTLFVLWALSPLAGQAILRMSSTTPAFSETTKPVQYFAPQSLVPANSELSRNKVEDKSINPNWERIQNLYTGLMLANQRSQTTAQDSWGNIKIPVYRGDNEGVDKDGWWPQAQMAASPAMSSLIGIPVALPNASTSLRSMVFSIDTTYFALNCSTFERIELDSPEMQSKNFTKNTYSAFRATLYMSVENNTEVFETFGGDPLRGLPPSNSTDYYPGPTGVLNFGSLVGDDQGGRGATSNVTEIFYSRCPYSQVMVANEITCYGDYNINSTDIKCSVTRQKVNKSFDQFRALDYQFVSTMVLIGNNSEERTDTEKYIANPSFASMDIGKDFDRNYALANISASTLSERFGVLVNTMWLTGSAHRVFMGGDLAGKEVNLTTTIGVFSSDAHLEYKTSWAWLAVLIVCSVILLVAGVASAALESCTIGPDFLGFANTAIKRSVKLPRDMNHLSARDRLLALQECEILLQDVRPRADVGKIALGVKEEKSTRLVPGRQYK